MNFVCGKCGSVCKQQFEDGTFLPPSKCPGDGCRSRTFAPSYSEASAHDFQYVKVQEAQGLCGGSASGVQDDPGNVPRTIECELCQNLVDSCSTGDMVRITGIATINTNDQNESGRKSKHNKFRGSCASSLYIKALSAEVQSASSGTGGGGFSSLGEEGEEMSNDYKLIAKLYSQFDGDIFPLFVLSLSPGIYGNELLKAGLILSLFGGTKKNAESKSGKVPLRGDIHVLMVGDPGMGKSQLLQAVSKTAPHGIYVTGNISSAAGLTASVAKDGSTGEFCLEAGAVVMADQGVCCVDEFDKMNTEYQSLLEVMEQQEVSVAKAGMIASLPARTTVVAAANPAKGHYDCTTSLSDNIKLSPALLSRFDLIFLLLDQPDMEVDGLLSEHVMQLHGKRQLNKENIPALGFRPAGQPQKLLPPKIAKNSKSKELLEKIKALADLGIPPIPPAIIQKCIRYSRKHVRPILSSEARLTLKECYLELRNQNANCVGGIPITVRQLESMVRLAEARARIDMREVVTREDANDVVAIMKESLYSTVIDEYGSIQVKGRKKGGKHAEAKRFLTTMSKMANAQGRKVFSVAEMYSIADDIHLQVDDMKTLIEKLNDAGELLKKGNGMYALA
jgi:DNA helicase MCM8